MAETLEDLTYDYEDEGVLVRKQIDRAILSKGSWATVMFLFQELDRAKGKFRPPKMAIVRFKKAKGSYRKQSSFNISNEKQARQITEVFEVGSLCKNDASYNIVKKYFCTHVESHHDGRNQPDAACDALSIGMRLETTIVKPGPTSADPTFKGCSPDVDPSTDSCDTPTPAL